jgi:hypothetical protein
VVVGNISAGSWGPPNELAYLKKFGLFDADVLVIVLSSGDYGDAPTFEPAVGILAGAPDHKPVLALWEGFQRYLLPKFKREPAPADVPAATPAAIEWCTRALKEMIELGRGRGAKVIVAQHLEREESMAAPYPGHAVIAAVARGAGVEPLELGPAFETARARGEQPYHDNIHITASGHRIIAEELTKAVEGVLKGGNPGNAK